MHMSAADQERNRGCDPGSRGEDVRRNRLRAGKDVVGCNRAAGSARAVGALVLPWLLVAFTALSVQRILALQIIAFLVCSCSLPADGARRADAARCTPAHGAPCRHGAVFRARNSAQEDRSAS